MVTYINNLIPIILTCYCMSDGYGRSTACACHFTCILHGSMIFVLLSIQTAMYICITASLQRIRLVCGHLSCSILSWCFHHIGLHWGMNLYDMACIVDKRKVQKPWRNASEMLDSVALTDHHLLIIYSTTSLTLPTMNSTKVQNPRRVNELYIHYNVNPASHLMENCNELA